MMTRKDLLKTMAGASLFSIVPAGVKDFSEMVASELDNSASVRSPLR